MKYAVLSMDVEDWYHLDYFDRAECDLSYSLLDGLEIYRELLGRHKIPSSFFVLGELAERLGPELKGLIKEGHEVGSHGWNHRRPLSLTIDEFSEDLRRSKAAIEKSLGSTVKGYRAPCFSLDEERLKAIAEAGYRYDSSRILFDQHPLYGTLIMDDFRQISLNIFRNDDFFEFQVSTLPVRGKNIPVSGGGYLRMIPWVLMKKWVRRYLRSNELYTLYIHPFELSRQFAPPVPPSTPWPTRLRFRFGRSKVAERLAQLMELLRGEGFEFMTFDQLRSRLLGQEQSLRNIHG